MISLLKLLDPVGVGLWFLHTSNVALDGNVFASSYDASILNIIFFSFCLFFTELCKLCLQMLILFLKVSFRTLDC